MNQRLEIQTPDHKGLDHKKKIENLPKYQY